MPLNDLKKGAKYKTEKELLENTKWIAIKWVFMQEQLFEALVSASRICLTNSTLRQFLCHCAYFPFSVQRETWWAGPAPSGRFWNVLEGSGTFCRVLPSSLRPPLLPRASQSPSAPLAVALWEPAAEERGWARGKGAWSKSFVCLSLCKAILAGPRGFVAKCWDQALFPWACGTGMLPADMGPSPGVLEIQTQMV